MLKITKRKITILEANLLINQIKLTPNIVGYSLKEWIAKEIFIAETENSQIAGACLSYDFHQDWHKIAALFLLEEYRNQGLGKSLFYASFNEAISREKNVYIISANPMVIKMMTDLDFLMFKSLVDFPKNYQFIFLFHSLKWLMNFYRIKEVIRKTFIYENPPFFFGLKLVKNNET